MALLLLCFWFWIYSFIQGQLCLLVLNFYHCPSIQGSYYSCKCQLYFGSPLIVVHSENQIHEQWSILCLLWAGLLWQIKAAVFPYINWDLDLGIFSPNHEHFHVLEFCLINLLVCLTFFGLFLLLLNFLCCNWVVDKSMAFLSKKNTGWRKRKLQRGSVLLKINKLSELSKSQVGSSCLKRSKPLNWKSLYSDLIQEPSLYCLVLILCGCLEADHQQL